MPYWLGLLLQRGVLRHLQSAARATLPCEPFLHVILALGVPVTAALGTLGPGLGKQEAAHDAPDTKGAKAQPESQTQMGLVAIHWPLDEPYCNCDQNTSDEQNPKRPPDTGTMFDGPASYSRHLDGRLALNVGFAHGALTNYICAAAWMPAHRSYVELFRLGGAGTCGISKARKAELSGFYDAASVMSPGTGFPDRKSAGTARQRTAWRLWGAAGDVRLAAESAGGDCDGLDLNGWISGNPADRLELPAIDIQFL